MTEGGAGVEEPFALGVSGAEPGAVSAGATASVVDGAGESLAGVSSLTDGGADGVGSRIARSFSAGTINVTSPGLVCSILSDLRRSFPAVEAAVLFDGAMTAFIKEGCVDVCRSGRQSDRLEMTMLMVALLQSEKEKKKVARRQQGSVCDSFCLAGRVMKSGRSC